MTCSAAGIIAASEAINRVYWNCKEGKMISLIINRIIMTPDLRIDTTIKCGAMIFIMSLLRSCGHLCWSRPSVLCPGHEKAHGEATFPRHGYNNAGLPAQCSHSHTHSISIGYKLMTQWPYSIYSPPTQNWSPKNWSFIGYNYLQNKLDSH